MTLFQSKSPSPIKKVLCHFKILIICWELKIMEKNQKWIFATDSHWNQMQLWYGWGNYNDMAFSPPVSRDYSALDGIKRVERTRMLPRQWCIVELDKLILDHLNSETGSSFSESSVKANFPWIVYWTHPADHKNVKLSCTQRIKKIILC